MNARHIKKTKKTSNKNSWNQIKDLIRSRRLEKMQQKQIFYDKFSNVSKIFQEKISALNSTPIEKTIITKIPKNIEAGQIFEIYIDGYLQKIKCPENATSGGKISFKITKTRNIHQEIKELVKLRKEYKIKYENGLYYGYPTCCINDFVIRTHNEQAHEPLQELAGKYTGFVPCMKCSKKILSKNLSAEDIIKNRKCKNKFPYDDEPGHAFPCKKHAVLIFLKKITIEGAIASGCKDCYVSDGDDDIDEYDDDDDCDNCDDIKCRQCSCCSKCK
jgi:hypothetical protein